MTNERKLLRRSIDNRIIGGVCGGLAEYFGIDPIWIRLAFLISLIPGGVPGLLIYFVLWLIMPNQK